MNVFDAKWKPWAKDGETVTEWGAHVAPSDDGEPHPVAVGDMVRLQTKKGDQTHKVVEVKEWPEKDKSLRLGGMDPDKDKEGGASSDPVNVRIDNMAKRFLEMRDEIEALTKRVAKLEAIDSAPF